MDNNIDNVNKSDKKRRTAIFALIVAAMMITSTVLGFVGGFAANKFLGSNKADGVTSTSIPVASTTSSESGNMNVSNVVKSVKNSVVSIECESQSQAQINPLYDSGSSTSKSAGSGVIITTDGYIVTNNHVVDGADKITVKTADEKSYTAKLVGVDSETDIAVIKIEAKGLKENHQHLK